MLAKAYSNESLRSDRQQESAVAYSPYTTNHSMETLSPTLLLGRLLGALT